MPPRFSICIPAYNRADQLPALLDSIVAQQRDDYEVVIAEDASPERERIRAVAQGYAERHGAERIRYHENAENLGYDGNFRTLLALARGDYCFIMGNDDLLCPGALATVAAALDRHPDTGVVLRSFASFQGSPENVVRVSRYFRDELLFPAGPDTVVAFFRRLVVMSGIVLHREEALRHGTARFDGTLFYQQHVAANILLQRPGLFLPDILVLYRLDGIPEFGTSAAERGRFVPGSHPPSADLNMLRGLFAIADHLDEAHGLRVARRIRHDFATYSYPTLAKQGAQPFGTFARFYADLAALGFWRSPLFHLYALLLLTLGLRRVDAIVHRIRTTLGHTPTLGRRPRAVRSSEARPGAA